MQGLNQRYAILSRSGVHAPGAIPYRNIFQYSLKYRATDITQNTQPAKEPKLC
jgi:hypothetical protein